MSCSRVLLYLVELFEYVSKIVTWVIFIRHEQASRTLKGIEGVFSQIFPGFAGGHRWVYFFKSDAITYYFKLNLTELMLIWF